MMTIRGALWWAWLAVRRGHRDQRGVSAVEFALVAIVLIMLLFGVWDFGLGIWQNSALAEATRTAARFAIVRGYGATGVTPVGAAPEGPAPCNGAVGPVSQVACTYGFPLDPSRLSVTVTWPSGFNRLGEPVVVYAEYTFTPILNNLFPVTINLKSTSRMIIACCQG